MEAKTYSLYIWESLDCGCYYEGYAIAIASSFGEACEVAANSSTRTNKAALKNQLLSTAPAIVPLNAPWGLLDTGWD
jgi:hypothetical protein